MDLDLRRYMRPLGRDTYLTVWIALALLILFGVLRYDNFASAYNVSSFLGYNSMFVLISVGMCLVIMTGGIDLSMGSVVALASVVAALLSPRGLVVALPAGLAAGAAVGLLNAGLVVILRLPPFMATLSTMLAANGAALWISGNRTVPVDWSSDFTRLGMGKVAGLVPWTILLAAVVVLLAWFLMERTSLGRTIAASHPRHLMGTRRLARTMGDGPEPMRLHDHPQTAPHMTTNVGFGAIA